MNDENGISILDLFKVMYGRKLTILIATVLTVIVAVLAVTFGYNKSNSTYVSNFSYNNSEINSGKYVDGSSFDYRALASLEVLNAVKATDSIYASIDVDKMYEKGDIDVQINYDKNDLKDNYNVYYRIAIKKKYFKNEFLAKQFISALTEYPVNRTKTIAQNLNYNSNLTSFSKTTTYESKLLFLQAQLELLDESYASMVEQFGDNIINDKKLSTYKNELDLYFEDNSIDTLKNELKSKCYVYITDDTINNLKTIKTNYLLEAQIKTIEDQIKRLLDAVKESNVSINQLDLNVYNEKLLEINMEIADKKIELDYIEGELANAESTDETYLASKQKFENKLNAMFEQMTEFTSIYKNNYNKAISNNVYVYYTNTAIIKEEQGFSVLVTVIISIFGGLIIAGVANLIIDHKKITAKNQNKVTA